MSESANCSNCGKSREQLIAERGRGFDIVGLHEAEDWQVCDKKCMGEWVEKEKENENR